MPSLQALEAEVDAPLVDVELEQLVEALAARRRAGLRRDSS